MNDLMPQAELHQDGSVHFLPLYKKNENGALQVWTITVEQHESDTTSHAGLIRTRWGQEDGAQQETRETISSGKNIGKKNETTAFEQAVAEALSKWEKQQKARKYVLTREAALAGERSEMVAGGYDCMLAFPIEKKPKALKFPCAIQRKYDGHRMLAVIVDGICTLWTRSRKQIVSMPHIARALAEHFPTGKHLIDGEGYVHPTVMSFEDLTSLLRASEPRAGHEKVEYHIYDHVSERPYVDRLSFLVKAFATAGHPLILAPTVIVQNEGEMNAQFEAFLEAGYEGAMARNLDGTYVGKRSPDLLKLKKFQDAEFEVIGVETETREVADSQGTRTMVYARFRFKGPNWSGPGDLANEGTTTLNAPQEVQREFLERPERVVGQMLTVKFQDLTKYGLPRFPKGLRFREDV